MLVIGLGLFVQLRWNHDSYAAVNSTVIWRDPPTWLRVIARQTKGPVVAAAAVVQLWCLSLAIAGLAMLLGLISKENAAGVAWFAFIVVGLAAVVVFLILAITGRRRS
jgi:hypothetical protein